MNITLSIPSRDTLFDKYIQLCTSYEKLKNDYDKIQTNLSLIKEKILNSDEKYNDIIQLIEDCLQ